MCIDYRDVNKISVKKQYPLLRIDNLLNYLKDSKLFTKLNLKSWYDQIPIESSDVSNVAFKTREGLFEWLVVPFDLTNAPTNFVRYMDGVLRPFAGKHASVYLDDILIFSRSWDEHFQ